MSRTTSKRRPTKESLASHSSKLTRRVPFPSVSSNPTTPFSSHSSFSPKNLTGKTLYEVGDIVQLQLPWRRHRNPRHPDRVFIVTKRNCKVYADFSLDRYRMFTVLSILALVEVPTLSDRRNCQMSSRGTLAMVPCRTFVIPRISQYP